MSPLSDRVKAFINCQLNTTGEAALRAFSTLPGLKNWNPEILCGRKVNDMFNLGLAFSIIGDNPSADKLRSKVKQSISLNPSDLSELHAGALLSHWETNPTFIEPIRNKRTPDLECSFPNGLILDVEVVRADIKHNHINLQNNLINFTDTLLPSDINWNIACFMADASIDQELSNVFDTAISLKLGESKEVSDRWKVVAVAQEQLPDFLAQVSMLTPEWWPQDCPSYIASSSLLGGSSHVFIDSQVPIVEYVGPIRRKAERHQNRDGRPFLIAMDSTELPRAHSRIHHELENFFLQWDHVSGVLVFEPRFPFGWWSKEYHWSIHPNPHAKIPLPTKLTQNVNEVQIINFELN